MSRVAKVLALQRAKETIDDRLTDAQDPILARAKAFNDLKHAGVRWPPEQVPAHDIVMHADGEEVVIRGYYWRGDQTETVEYRIPIAFANGDQSELDAIKAQAETERRRRITSEEAAARKALVRKEEADRKEFERLSKKYAS